MNTQILPGSEVMVFDPVINKLEGAYKKAIVLRRYGYISKYIEKEFGREAAKYPDMVDVRFIHSDRVSAGHFTYELIEIDTTV